MRSAFTALALLLLASPSAWARDYADEPTAKEALRFLDEAKAVAITGENGYFDGGSISFSFVTPAGEKLVFALSNERQRQELRRPLSVLKIWLWADPKNGDKLPLSVIKLIPDAMYDETAARLRDRLTTGISGGLQEKWPQYGEDANELVRLLERGGSHQDLEGFHRSMAKRLAAAHQKFLESRQAAATAAP
jgi:hypothetical protein